MHTGETTAGFSEHDDLAPLFVPVPDNLAELLGYRGEARFVALPRNARIAPGDMVFHVLNIVWKE